ncbi:MAG: four helix bundle protein [Salibacteraceae bacterium]|jgi:four helix bundle protein
MPRRNIIQEKSFDFALDIIKTSNELTEKKEFILSRQLLRSGTSIGANVRESKNAESKKDFIHKLSISQKECDECIYWIELLFHSQYINSETYQKLNNKAIELLKILKSIIITTRKNMVHKAKNS